MSESAENSEPSHDEDSDKPDSGGPQGSPPNIGDSKAVEGGPELGLDFEQYKIAGSEARYRDQMLFTTFYLSLVALAVILQVVIRLFGDEQFTAVMVVSLVAAIGFGNLLWWSYSTKQARNRAWGFRKQVEEKFSTSDEIKTDEGLRLNHVIGNYDIYDFKQDEFKNKNQVLGSSSSDLVILFAVLSTVGWILTAGGTAAVSLNVISTETVYTMIIGATITFFIIFVIAVFIEFGLNSNIEKQ